MELEKAILILSEFIGMMIETEDLLTLDHSAQAWDTLNFEPFFEIQGNLWICGGIGTYKGIKAAGSSPREAAVRATALVIQRS